MRSIWSGALSFGLINIPVKLYVATQEHAIEFDLLHKTDMSPIRYAKICKSDGKEIPYEDIVKGYEYKKGEYIALTEEDFKNVNLEKSKTIDIQSFTYEREIESIYYEKPYYLEPDKGAAKAYALLREALKRSEKVAIASFVLRNREHIAMVKPYDQVLVVNQLRFESEIRSIAKLDVPESKTTPKEVEMAVKLIDELTQAFNPKDFKDTYIEKLQAVIDEKLKGRKSKKKISEPEYTQIQDIMSKLKASLQHSKRIKPASIRPKRKRVPRK